MLKLSKLRTIQPSDYRVDPFLSWFGQYHYAMEVIVGSQYEFSLLKRPLSETFFHNEQANVSLSFSVDMFKKLLSYYPFIQATYYGTSCKSAPTSYSGSAYFFSNEIYCWPTVVLKQSEQKFSFPKKTMAF